MGFTNSPLTVTLVVTFPRVGSIFNAVSTELLLCTKLHGDRGGGVRKERSGATNTNLDELLALWCVWSPGATIVRIRCKHRL